MSGKEYFAYSATEAKGQLTKIKKKGAELGKTEVRVKICFTGICHSDVSMLNNEWGFASFPLVPGHEGAGHVIEIGSGVTRVKIGQRVGVSWVSRSCNRCENCEQGDTNMCQGDAFQQTIAGRDGTFAEQVIVDEGWAVPLPDAISLEQAGPLLCGGVTGFNPIDSYDVRASKRVGVVGVGGIGSMIMELLRAYGCQITAFSASENKKARAMELGATHFVSSMDSKAIRGTEKLDLIIVTANVELDYSAFLGALRPRGRLHFVGAVPSVKISAFDMMPNQSAVSASPLGSPAQFRRMFDVLLRHKIDLKVNVFPIAKVNTAIDLLVMTRPANRLVLKICEDISCKHCVVKNCGADCTCGADCKCSPGECACKKSADDCCDTAKDCCEDDCKCGANCKCAKGECGAKNCCKDAPNCCKEECKCADNCKCTKGECGAKNCCKDAPNCCEDECKCADACKCDSGKCSTASRSKACGKSDCACGADCQCKPGKCACPTPTEGKSKTKSKAKPKGGKSAAKGCTKGACTCGDSCACGDDCNCAVKEVKDEKSKPKKGKSKKGGKK